MRNHPLPLQCHSGNQFVRNIHKLLTQCCNRSTTHNAQLATTFENDILLTMIDPLNHYGHLHSYTQRDDLKPSTLPLQLDRMMAELVTAVNITILPSKTPIVIIK